MSASFGECPADGDEFTADPPSSPASKTSRPTRHARGKPGPSALAHTAQTSDDEREARARTVR